MAKSIYFVAILASLVGCIIPTPYGASSYLPYTVKIFPNNEYVVRWGDPAKHRPYHVGFGNKCMSGAIYKHDIESADESDTWFVFRGDTRELMYTVQVSEIVEIVNANGKFGVGLDGIFNERKYSTRERQRLIAECKKKEKELDGKSNKEQLTGIPEKNTQEPE